MGNIMYALAIASRHGECISVVLGTSNSYRKLKVIAEEKFRDLEQFKEDISSIDLEGFDPVEIDCMFISHQKGASGCLRLFHEI